MLENLDVPLQGDRDAGELGGAHQSCQVPFRSPSPNVGLLLRRCSGKGLHLAMTGDDQIANICWIMEKAREFQKNIYFCFIVYAKAFDYVDHNKL